jgi:outer membrane lipoprotein-sorting protein
MIAKSPGGKTRAACLDEPLVTFVLLFFLLLAGCHHEEPESIQQFPLTDAAATLRALADRAHLVHTLSGEGLITLIRPDGESIRLDGALVMRPPDDARVRAWKFGRAIFDLTITPDGVWAITPDDPQRKEQIQAAGVNAAKLAKTWSVLSGGFFDEPNLTAHTQGEKLILRRQIPGEPIVICEVDRSTLTPRKYLMLDDAGKQRFSLTLDHYRQFTPIAWPTRLRAISEGGTVEVDLHDVQINPDLPQTAFTPPRRAEKLP